MGIVNSYIPSAGSLWLEQACSSTSLLQPVYLDMPASYNHIVNAGSPHPLILNNSRCGKVTSQYLKCRRRKFSPNVEPYLFRVVTCETYDINLDREVSQSVWTTCSGISFLHPDITEANLRQLLPTDPCRLYCTCEYTISSPVVQVSPLECGATYTQLASSLCGCFMKVRRLITVDIH